MQMGHKKHEHCSRAREEDAPKVLGHGSISEWAVMAAERRTPWSGWYLRNGGNKILPRNSILSTQEFKVRGSTYQFNSILF
jgi:hypothetical protein